MTATAADALVMLFSALPEDAQDDAYERIGELRLRRLAGDESAMAVAIRSMRTVAEYVGHAPSVDEYKQASQELIADDVDVLTFARIYAHFGHSWPRAKEALALSETTTTKRIEARFRYRKVGKVWRFTEPALREALAACVEHYGGRCPSVAEFDWWRDRQFELAAASGEELHLPSPSPYRRRWKTWENALLHFGYTPDQVAERLQRG